MATNEGMYSVSTTLIVPNEKVPTYKAIGYLIDSSKVEVGHLAEMDSGSSGNSKDGTFHANLTEVKTLDELADLIKIKKNKIMNEVNINMHEDAYVGLFFNKCNSPRLLANVILAGKALEIQTGIQFPIYMYDYENGILENVKLNSKEKMDYIEKCIEGKILRTSQIFCETEKGYIVNTNIFNELDINRVK